MNRNLRVFVCALVLLSIQTILILALKHNAKQSHLMSKRHASAQLDINNNAIAINARKKRQNTETATDDENILDRFQNNDFNDTIAAEKQYAYEQQNNDNKQPPERKPASVHETFATFVNVNGYEEKDLDNDILEKFRKKNDEIGEDENSAIAKSVIAGEGLDHLLKYAGKQGREPKDGGLSDRSAIVKISNGDNPNFEYIFYGDDPDNDQRADVLSKKKKLVEMIEIHDGKKHSRRNVE